MSQFNCVVKEWTVDFIQLGGGAFSSEIQQIIFPEFQLSRVCFNSKVKQEGTSPKGYWSFAFVEDKRLFWRNYEVPPYSVIVYQPGSVINAVSSKGFEVHLLSVREDLFLRLINEENVEGVQHKLDHGLLSINPSNWRQLRAKISSGIDQCLKEGYYDEKSFLSDFLKLVFQSIKESSVETKKVSNLSRLEVLSQAELFIRNHISEQISVTMVAEYCEISERTLLYTFKKRFGVGVKTFIKILRLNAVYEKLHNEMDEKTISNVAREYGFWHMGQFHKDYKEFFDELPSYTSLKSSFIL